MKPVRIGTLWMLSLAVLACGDAGGDGAEPEGPAAPTREAVGNARVILSALDSVSADLVDGGGLASSGARLTLLAAYTAAADFDGDGVPERAALVTAEPGGDRVFMGIVGFRASADGAVQVADKLLGDRQEIHRFESVGDSLRVVLTTQGPDDEACCPTRRAEQIYRIDGGTWRLWRDNTIDPSVGGAEAQQ
ncbi:MAG: hypothetical protein KJO11_04925 [Gemmatimonadetes bacterium]|nr:hypothetical protein [Gemmatimonadota bacterium]